MDLDAEFKDGRCLLIGGCQQILWTDATDRLGLPRGEARTVSGQADLQSAQTFVSSGHGIRANREGDDPEVALNVVQC